MRSAIGWVVRAQGMKQEAVKLVPTPGRRGARHCVGDRDAWLARKQENDALHGQVVPAISARRKLRFHTSRFSLLFDGIERMVKRSRCT